MRILYCSSTYYPNQDGQAIFTQNLAQGMAAYGHDVTVITSTVFCKSDAEATPGIHVINPHSIRLPKIHQSLSLTFFASPLVRDVFDKFQPELVHVQDPSPLSQEVMREAQRKNIPVIITHHTGPEIMAPYINPQNPNLKRYMYWIGWKYLLTHLNQADQVIVPSKFSAQMLASRGIHAGIGIIGCGVQLDQFRPELAFNHADIRQRYGLDPDKTLFTYVGRIDYEKNLDILIQAISRLDRPDIQLALAGEGNKEDHLHHLVTAGCHDQQVVFLGSIPHSDLPELLNSSDVFIMPGKAESFSIATLEAMACAKPVLAAQSAALPELVEHNVSGYLFQPDQIDDLNKYINILANHKDQREKMGTAGRAKAENFSMQKMVRSYERVYLSLLAKGKTGIRKKNHHLAGQSRETQFVRVARSLLFTRFLGIMTIIVVLLISAFYYDHVLAKHHSGFVAPNLQTILIDPSYYGTSPYRLGDVLTAKEISEKIQRTWKSSISDCH